MQLSWWLSIIHICPRLKWKPCLPVPLQRKQLITPTTPKPYLPGTFSPSSNSSVLTTCHSWKYWQPKNQKQAPTSRTAVAKYKDISSKEEADQRPSREKNSSSHRTRSSPSTLGTRGTGSPMESCLSSIINQEAKTPFIPPTSMPSTRSRLKRKLCFPVPVQR